MASLTETFAQAGLGKVVILDGGMGTTLQAPPFELALDSALWSSELLATEEGRSQLRKLHQTWVDAGAHLIGSCTYQSSLPLFLPSTTSSYAQDEIDSALQTMNAALPLVTSTSALSCLSLGPWGAQLSPGQEYGGLYAPPFGPHVDSPSKPGYSAAAGEACPLPHIEPSGDAEEDTLAGWHLQRLQHFAQSGAFEKVDLIAFETTPVLKEVSAIRRALHLFNASRAGKDAKAGYISFVFPATATGDLRFPDKLHVDKSLAEQAHLIIRAVFSTSSSQAEIHGLGVYCTSPVKLHAVVDALSSSLASFADKPREKPWLVLYPDGGSVYDVVSRTWSNPEGMNEERWAKTLADVVGSALEGGEWEGVVAGGCCKAGPGSIKELRREAESRGWVTKE